MAKKIHTIFRQNHYRVELMLLSIFLFLIGIAALFCLYCTTACLISVSKGYQLPDIEDIDVGETMKDIG